MRPRPTPGETPSRHPITEQRERLLDLVDAVLSGVVDEICPRNVSPEDWKWPEIPDPFHDFFGRKAPVGLEHLLRVFRVVDPNEIDRAWVEHLTNMERLRDGIGLRGYGQRDPKQEYKKRATTSS